MNLFQLFLSNRKKREPLLLESVRAVLFLIYFLISLYLSFNKDTLLFGITVGGMVVYALLVIGTFKKIGRIPKRCSDSCHHDYRERNAKRKERTA